MRIGVLLKDDVVIVLDDGIRCSYEYSVVIIHILHTYCTNRVARIYEGGVKRSIIIFFCPSISHNMNIEH
jgi:hypothetical protein